MSRPIDEEKLFKLRKGVRTLITEEGYKGVSITKLSKLTGISAGYLYRYYDNKEDLINASMEQIVDEGSRVLAEEATRTDSPQEFVSIIFRMFMSVPVENECDMMFFVKVFMDPSLTDLKIKLINMLEESVVEKMEEVSELIEKDRIHHYNRQTIVIALSNIFTVYKVKKDFELIAPGKEFPISDDILLEGIISMMNTLYDNNK